jgi:hypothetical protein
MSIQFQETRNVDTECSIHVDYLVVAGGGAGGGSTTGSWSRRWRWRRRISYFISRRNKINISSWNILSSNSWSRRTRLDLSPAPGTKGSDSVFSTITSTGGGGWSF